MALKRALSGLTGRVLVSKVFLGKTQQAGGENGLGIDQLRNQVNGRHNGVLANTALRPSSGAHSSDRYKDRLESRLESGSINWLDYPGVDSVCIPHSTDEKQCTWAVHDQALVLPEYIVEFEYTVDRGFGVLGQAVVRAGRPFVPERDVLRNAKEETDALERVDPEVRTICGPLAPFLGDVRLPAGRSSLGGAKNGEACRDEAYLAALNMPPMLTSRARTLILTEESVLRQSRATAVGGVTCLNLHNNSIRKIEALSGLTNLRVLILSFNGLSKLEGLEGLTQLEKLDVSYNFVKRIDGLKGLQALRTLDLTSNQIFKLDDIGMLKRSVSWRSFKTTVSVAEDLMLSANKQSGQEYIRLS